MTTIPYAHKVRIEISEGHAKRVILEDYTGKQIAQLPCMKVQADLSPRQYTGAPNDEASTTALIIGNHRLVIENV